MRECRECRSAIGQRNQSGLCRRCHCAMVGHANRRRPDVRCERCGTAFRFEPTRRERFCSWECYVAGRELLTGSEHWAWKEDVSRWGHYGRAQRLFAREPCAVCGVDEQIVRHHIDGDPSNNVRENIRFLCRSHHVKLHYEQGDIDISGLVGR